MNPGSPDEISSASPAWLGSALASNFNALWGERWVPDSAPAKAGAEITPRGELLAGLDIGTSKVCVAVGERQPDGVVKILGIGQAPSLGIRGGEIVDLEAASRCVREALVDAEVQSDVMIGNLVLAVHLREPVCNRFGKRANKSLRCLQNLDLEFRDVVLHAEASALAVLDSDMMDRGALVIDVGAGTTSYGVYANGEVKNFGWSDAGGDNSTNDRSLGQRGPSACAKNLKIEDGSSWYFQSIPHESIVMGETVFTRKVAKGEMPGTIIRRRVRAIFDRMKARIETSGVRLASLGAGVRLTGGCSLLRGIDDLAEEVFDIPAQRAGGIGVKWAASVIETPGHSCAIGLLKLGATGDPYLVRTRRLARYQNRTFHHVEDTLWGHSFSCLKWPLKLSSAAPMDIPPLQCNADRILKERIAGSELGIGRRDFLRITGIAGLGCAVNLQCRHAEALLDNSAKLNANFVVGLDIGTSKVCVAVAERRPDGTIKIHGFGEVPSRGVCGWGISDLEAAGAGRAGGCRSADRCDDRQRYFGGWRRVRRCLLPSQIA